MGFGFAETFKRERGLCKQFSSDGSPIDKDHREYLMIVNRIFCLAEITMTISND
jgi:hypothetical protein